MTNISGVPSAVVSALSSFLTFKPRRRIGVLVPNATIEETSVDEVVITQHPVQQGAAITDHAYVQPAVVTIRCGWTNSTLDAGFNPNYTTEIYDKLLKLKDERIPFDVVTGNRKFANMLIRSLTKTTDQRTENALMVTIVCQQLNLVNTQVTSISTPNDQQKTPQKTGNVQNFGVKQLAPGSNFKETG